MVMCPEQDALKFGGDGGISTVFLGSKAIQTVYIWLRGDAAECDARETFA